MDDEITKCSECESLMLERTAIKYDGKCIPCSKGYRKDIENSKIYYEEQKNRLQLPESVYWRELCEITSDPERGFESLDENEKLYYAVCLLEGEIYNGGFEQYFTNSSSDHFDHAIRALEVLNDPISLEIVQKATKLLFKHLPVPQDREMRLELLDKHISFDDKLVAEELDKLDAAFSENAEKILLENIKRFAETNWLYENITNSI